ncbi:MAG: M1 family metallopeptidase [Deltaproteobacteria bacterium]|nr:M1 family metallopeptidase [Deltaproteobacteria bacterium]
MGMRTAVLAALVVASCGQPASTTTPRPPAPPVRPDPVAAQPLSPPRPTLRLPRNFLPTSYQVRLAIDPEKSDFTGAITIAGTMSSPSAKLWLHGRKLKITRGVAQRDGETIDVAVAAVGEELLELTPARPLAAGAWQLALEYTGTFDTLNTTGAFKQTVAGRSYVYTQLEAVYARRVFPCFDEPDSKVPWQLTLDVPKQLVAVSNTPIASETPLGETHKRVAFAATKPLPSYLVAFGVGPFEVIDAGATARGTPIRVLTLAGRAAEGAWAAKTSGRLLEILEAWFGMPYPYEKLDMLTIPLTVGFGAMENAGLVTFTETLILMDPARAAKARQHRWIVVAAHELAHQWFGDLVTMKWWDDIWLNEGFANWMEHKVSARFDPTWKDEQSALDMREAALDEDGLVSARRIRQPIATPDDIFNVFDGITYDKGASVLHMFETYLGPETFQKGVRAYLAAHAHGNATSADFAAAISAAAGKDVTAAFASFLDQAGAPEVAATLSCTAGKAKLALAQQRYVPPGAPRPDATAPWTLPVCVAYDKDGARAEACTLLTAPSGTLDLDAKACPRWVMPNVHGRGYHRNAYTTAQITALRDEAWPKLSWTERRAVYFDLTEAVTTGKMPLQLALSFVPKLLAGNDRFTVVPAIDLPASLDFFVPDDLRGKYEGWLRATFGAAAASAGLTGKDTDSLDVESMREGLVDAVGWLGRDPALVAEAGKLAPGWRALPQSIRGRVLAIAADASPDFFDAILRAVPAEPDRTRRGEVLRALAGVRDLGRQQRALALLLSPKLDLRETISMLHGGTTEANRAAARAFFRDHAGEILPRMPNDETSGGPAGLAGLFTKTCRADQRAEIVAYVQQTFGKMPGAARVIAQKLEGMDQCIARRALIENELRGWLTGVKLPRPKKQ